MKITLEEEMVSGIKRFIIELSELDITRHIESRFERTARLLHEKTNKKSDLLFYLSEWAKTEEELKEKSEPLSKGEKGK